MPAVDGGTGAIRRAVASGEFRKAQTLWEDHARQLREAVRSGTMTKEKLAETGELVEWCRVAALCARSHAQARLNRIAVAGRYGAPGGHPASRFSARG
jgi:hypothetical protein